MPRVDYGGHTIWVSVKPTFRPDRWKFFVLVGWDGGLTRRLKTLTSDENEFETTREARRAGLQFATDWINAGKPEPIPQFSSPD
jgi:hypothetical protein